MMVPVGSGDDNSRIGVGFGMAPVTAAGSSFVLDPETGMMVPVGSGDDNSRMMAAAAVKVPKLKINLGERVDSHSTSHSRGHSSSHHHHHHKSSSSSSSSKKHKKHKRRRIESDSDDDIVSV